MKELLEFSFSGINIIPTVLLIFVFIYWLIVIMGVIDIDTLDFDLDMDADVDVDGDFEVDGLSSVLAFFNIGQMPLMIFVTFFTIPLWTCTLLVNDFIGHNSILIGALILFGVGFGCLFVAKFLTIPIAKLYKKVLPSLDLKRRQLMGEAHRCFERGEVDIDLRALGPIGRSKGQQ